MPWPDWRLWRKPDGNPHNDDHNDKAPPKATTDSGQWASSLNRTDYTHYTTPQTVAFAAVTTATTLALVHAYKTYLRRIPGANYLKPGFFRRRSLYGYVTSVGDGDGFRLFHTPGGRLMGWGSRWRPIGTGNGKGKGKKSEGTLSVRIAGVDAPEMAHFGHPAQPHAKEALEWLKGSVEGSWGVWKQDVGLLMLRRGLATVYEAKSGSEFGEMEEVYREAEKDAKAKGVGMWARPGVIGKLLGAKTEGMESPREYKTRIAAGEDKMATAKTATTSGTEEKPGLISRLLGSNESPSSTSGEKPASKPSAHTPKSPKGAPTHARKTTAAATRKKGK